MKTCGRLEITSPRIPKFGSRVSGQVHGAVTLPHGTRPQVEDRLHRGLDENQNRSIFNPAGNQIPIPRSSSRREFGSIFQMFQILFHVLK
jgi:hypothetical protein